MNRFTAAGRACIEADNLHGALALALMIPDICGSIDNPGLTNSRVRYEKWAGQWVEPRFTTSWNDETTVWISAADLFQIRCSFMHSGRTDIPPGKALNVASFKFFDRTTGSHLNMYREAATGHDPESFLQLKADQFSLEIFDAADEWDVATAEDESVQIQKRGLMQIYSRGSAFANDTIEFG